MDSHRLNRLPCFILAGSILSILCLGWNVEMPGSVNAVVGSCVVVPCQTSVHQRVIWYQYHSVKYPKVYDSQDPAGVIAQFRGRTSLLGMAREGNCSLRIEAVRPEDNGISLYVWINPDKKSKQKFYNQIVVIRVIEVKAVPLISVQGSIVEGSILSLNCSMFHSCPTSLPPIIWKGLSGGKNSSITVMADGVPGVWLSRATMSRRASRQDHGSRVTCSVQLSAGVIRTSLTLMLNVSYAPVDVNVTVKELSVTEGRVVTLMCRSHGNPPPRLYRWLETRGGETVQLNLTQREVSVPSVRRGSRFSCVAQNHLGERQSDWISLDIQIPPVILSGSSCSGTGRTLRCVCQVEAHPNATLSWGLNGAYIPASFTSVIEQNKSVVSAVLTGPLEVELNVSCMATNSLGNVTLYLPIYITHGLLPWLLTAVVCGCSILCVGAVFLFRKRYIMRRSVAYPDQGFSTCPRRGSGSEMSQYCRPPRSTGRSMPRVQANESSVYKVNDMGVDAIYQNC
ncbi:hypothetical protein AAFF_G00329070 [Aldrovandia affinis]|uniref:Ig-like domain-containing protein n=1 Tax=Aldrovandia affinis TaxID=143900 RepID=A0AAD7SLU2_9TELE|nr:hypothetical protein AAFF_G00329070 [Aldrovandia affinis]